MKKIALACIAILFCSTAIFAATNHNITDTSKSIYVKKSAPTFTITLQSNPSTGYSWFLTDYNSKLVMPVARKYIAPTKGLAGAPGIEKWTFKITKQGFVAPQIITIKMAYARPWSLSNVQPTAIKVVTYDS